MIERRLTNFSFYMSYIRGKDEEYRRGEEERVEDERGWEERERVLSIAAPPFELRFGEANIEFNEFCRTPAITR